MGNTINARGIHFVNKYYMPNDLSIIKEVRGNDAQAQYDRNNEKEWQFTLSLKFQDDVDNEDTITYNYDIYDSKDAESPTLEDESITLTKDVFSNTYSGTFTLKHNQKITIKGILSGTEYKIVENNAGNNPNGYITTIKNGSGIIGGQEGAVNTNIQVDVINFNPAERDLTIQKQVKGQVANYEANWEFNVKLVAPANFRLASSYPYIKTAIDGTTTEGVLRLDSSNSAKVTLKHGEKVTIKGLPEGTHYEVTEIGANANGYETQIPSNSFGILERNQEMTFVNSFIKYYQLSLKKIVAGNNASTDEKFKFRVQFNEGDFKLRDIEYVYPNGSPSNGKLVLPGTQAGANDKVLIPTGDGNSYYVEFELKHNDVVLFENIIEGTTYSIKEELATDQSGENGYEVKVPNNAEGTIDKDNPAPNVEFVNIRYSLNDITITKNVEGEAGLTEDREFNFRIKFKPAEDVEFKTSYPYEKRKSTVLTDSGNVELVQNADGTYSAEFTLKHDEHYTIKNIPERTQYWVEEIEANQNGYETNVTKGQSNGAYVDTQKEVEFTNKKLGYYPLTIEKIVQGDNIDVNREFNFRITFIPSEDVKELAESYPYTGSRSGNLQLTNNNNGTYTAEFTLKGSENIRIDGIPEGTKYIVEELDANEGGYIETKSNNTEGTLSGQGQTVTYTNIKSQLNSLTLSKEVKGQLNSALTSVWNFEIRLTPPIGQTKLYN